MTSRNPFPEIPVSLIVALRDSIDHAPKAHDDVANAVSGVLVSLVGRAAPTVAMFLSARHRGVAA